MFVVQEKKIQKLEVTHSQPERIQSLIKYGAYFWPITL